MDATVRSLGFKTDHRMTFLTSLDGWHLCGTPLEFPGNCCAHALPFRFPLSQLQQFVVQYAFRCKTMAYDFRFRLDLVCMTTEFSNQDLDVAFSWLTPDQEWQVRDAAAARRPRRDNWAEWRWSVVDRPECDDASDLLNESVRTVVRSLNDPGFSKIPQSIRDASYITIQIFNDSHSVWQPDMESMASLASMGIALYIEVYRAATRT